MKKLIWMIALFIIFLSGCSAKEDGVRILEVTKTAKGEKLFIAVTVKANKNGSLERVSFDVPEVDEQYLIEATNNQTVTGWTSASKYPLPAYLEKGKEYTVVTVSRDPSLTKASSVMVSFENADFHFSYDN